MHGPARKGLHACTLMVLEPVFGVFGVFGNTVFGNAVFGSVRSVRSVFGSVFGLVFGVFGMPHMVQWKAGWRGALQAVRAACRDHCWVDVPSSTAVFGFVFGRVFGRVFGCVRKGCVREHDVFGERCVRAVFGACTVFGCDSVVRFLCSESCVRCSEEPVFVTWHMTLCSKTF